MINKGSCITNFDSSYTDFSLRYIQTVKDLEKVVLSCLQKRKITRLFDDLNRLCKIFDGNRCFMDVLLRRLIKRSLVAELPKSCKVIFSKFLWHYTSFSKDIQVREIKLLFLSL